MVHRPASTRLRRVMEPEFGAIAPESIFAGVEARILIQVELELGPELRYCRITSSSRSSHFPIAFLISLFLI